MMLYLLHFIGEVGLCAVLLIVLFAILQVMMGKK